jgi:predicted lipoprotein
MKRFLPWIIGLTLLAGLCLGFPPFHIKSKKARQDAIAETTFNPAAFVGKFWTETLLPASGKAVDAEKVLAVIAESPGKVREQFGRTVGISSSYGIHIRGKGRVVSVSDDAVGLAVLSKDDVADVTIPLGFLVSNIVRDGTGLLESSSYPNAQQFNEISAELNKIVEEKVMPEVKRGAVVGKQLEFVGCVEVEDEETDLKPLEIVPISVKSE